MNKKYFSPVKVVAAIFTTVAVCLEIWNIYDISSNNHILQNLNVLLWFAHFVFIAHLVEAIVAIIFASSKNQQPLKYGVYTFFVGTVGLLELFDNPDQVSRP
ncbi:MAG: hypothetical protein ACFB02_06955 [Mastigocoleus sp.]